MTPFSTSPPRRLAVAVACVASAMLLFELMITRIFSVLFFYHFSFFAISLVMSGLVLGGIWASRWDVRRMDDGAFASRLARLAWGFSGLLLAAALVSKFLPRLTAASGPSLPVVALHAVVFLPGLVAAGAFLAVAFARERAWIGRLYAWDLVAAAAACIAAIFALRTLPGPAALTIPIGLAACAGLALGARVDRLASGALAAVAAVLLVASLATDGRLLRLETPGTAPVLERWNEHSRIQVLPVDEHGQQLVIDRSAATGMLRIPPEPDGAPVREQAWWGDGPQYTAYQLGRPVRDVAIIGVGGGRDLYPPLAHKATRVDGYELNGILVDFLEREFVDYNAITTRPEVHLIHDEARVGITHSNRQYDVIQASLIDTWAATASGGFVLSENGLYTREGWRVFLSHLSDQGVLTMSRWWLPTAPAETERLVSLAAAGLADAGIADAREHVILTATAVSESGGAFTGAEEVSVATILVSRAPFTPEEVARIRDLCAAQGLTLLVAPGVAAADPVVDRLLDPATRAAAIAASPFDISPPSDTKPYFFLQVRPADALDLFGRQFGGVTEITFNGVRVLVVLALCSLALTLVVVGLTIGGLPGSGASSPERVVYRWMTLYFLGIGFGYILVQLALHQRLILIVGHPTLALSIVLFSMLLGTGIGAAASERLFPSGSLARAGSAILGTLVLLAAVLPALPAIDQIGSAALRTVLVGLIVGAVGFALGLAFPLGVRRVAPTGEWAVQKMWAINGAASIAGSVLAAFVGLVAGSWFVLLAGIGCYAVAVAAGIAGERRAA
jgi:hypothetical protein